jgi:hypothetical protein
VSTSHTRSALCGQNCSWRLGTVVTYYSYVCSLPLFGAGGLREQHGSRRHGSVAATWVSVPPLPPPPSASRSPSCWRQISGWANGCVGVHVQVRHLSSPACPDSYQIKQLLRWFRESCRETSEDFPKGDSRWEP